MKACRDKQAQLARPFLLITGSWVRAPPRSPNPQTKQLLSKIGAPRFRIFYFVGRIWGAFASALTDSLALPSYRPRPCQARLHCCVPQAEMRNNLRCQSPQGAIKRRNQLRRRWFALPTNSAPPPKPMAKALPGPESRAALYNALW